MAKLGVEICGIHFANPVMPAAGPPGKDGAMCQAAARGAPEESLRRQSLLNRLKCRARVWPRSGEDFSIRNFGRKCLRNNGSQPSIKWQRIRVAAYCRLGVYC